MFYKTQMRAFAATLYCGLREGYSGRLRDIADARNILHAFTKNYPTLGIYLQEGRFLYSDSGNSKEEPGFSVMIRPGMGSIMEDQDIRQRIEAMAQQLATILYQQRVYIHYPDGIVCVSQQK